MEVGNRATPDLCGTNLLARHREVVLDGENVGHLIRAKIGQVLVGLIVNHTNEGDIAVLYDDVNRRYGGLAVAKEHGIAVDGAVNGSAQLVVHRGNRENLYVVGDAGDAFNALYSSLRIGLQRRTHHLTAQGDFVSLNLERQIVEHRIVGQQQKLVAHFLD